MNFEFNYKRKSFYANKNYAPFEKFLHHKLQLLENRILRRLFLKKLRKGRRKRRATVAEKEAQHLSGNPII